MNHSIYIHCQLLAKNMDSIYNTNIYPHKNHFLFTHTHTHTHLQGHTDDIDQCVAHKPSHCKNKQIHLIECTAYKHYHNSNQIIHTTSTPTDICMKSCTPPPLNEPMTIGRANMLFITLLATTLVLILFLF